jgi:ribosomal protein S18 acetylase RimI-like enzyme
LDSRAAALWLPPDVQPNEQGLAALFHSTLGEAKQEAMFSIFEQMGRFHPETLHWYLPLIGVTPGQQGKGLGSILLDRALRRCDRDGIPAYLESTNPRNIALYERHGFEIIGKIQAGDSPEIIPMLRSPN